MTFSNINKLLDELLQKVFLNKITKEYEDFFFKSLLKKCIPLFQSENLKFQMGFMGDMGTFVTKGTALLNKVTGVANEAMDHGNKILDKGSEMIRNTSKAAKKAMEGGNKILDKGNEILDKVTKQKLQFSFLNLDDKNIIRQIINKLIMISKYCKNDTNILLMFIFAIMLYDSEIEKIEINNKEDLLMFVKKNINRIETYNKIEMIIVSNICDENIKKKVEHKLCSYIIKILTK